MEPDIDRRHLSATKTIITWNWEQSVEERGSRHGNTGRVDPRVTTLVHVTSGLNHVFELRSLTDNETIYVDTVNYMMMSGLVEPSL